MSYSLRYVASKTPASPFGSRCRWWRQQTSIRYSECEPADGTNATAQSGCFGRSRCGSSMIRLHHLRRAAEAQWPVVAPISSRGAGAALSAAGGTSPALEGREHTRSRPTPDIGKRALHWNWFWPPFPKSLRLGRPTAGCGRNIPTRSRLAVAASAHASPPLSSVVSSPVA
jgi:hypothetical protein